MRKENSCSNSTMVRPESRQTEQQRLTIEQLSKQYPKTGRAFSMVQTIDEMYECKNSDEATQVFDKLISWFRKSRLEPMRKVANSLKSHKQTTLAYYYHRVTNAIAERINSFIQAAKRRARGYRTFVGYESMIYSVVGKLYLESPPLFD